MNRRKFYDHATAWLIFAAIVTGMYMVFMFGIEILVTLSEPLYEVMKAVGL